MPHLTSYMVILLALVSFAQAGPFGLKNGMTVDEIIDAGFETSWEGMRKIRGPIGEEDAQNTLENIKDNKTKLKEIYGYTAHKDYPNNYFVLKVDNEFGLTQLSIYTFVADEKALDLLYEDYHKKIKLKYKNKIHSSWKSDQIQFYSIGFGYRAPYPNDIVSINLSGEPTKEIVDKKNGNHLLKSHISLRYQFSNSILSANRNKKEKNNKQLEAIKNLLPKEEDL